MGKGNRIRNARAGGTSRSKRSSGNPPANDFTWEFTFEREESYDPLLKKLSFDGFIDAKSVEAAYLLTRVSYHHLKPYLDFALENPTQSGPSVKRAHDVYLFDRRFQSLIFKYIGTVELHLRARYAHLMQYCHGNMALYDDRLFLDKPKYENTMSIFEGDIERRSKRDRRLKGILEKDDGRLPISLAVEHMTFGTLSRLFDNTSARDVTDGVAKSFSSRKSELSSWIRSISDVRNICAHFDSYITRKQIPSTPRKVRGLEHDLIDSRNPFYIVVLLAKLMGGRQVFPDMNLCHAYRMCGEVHDLILDFKRSFPGVVESLDIPNGWEEEVNDASDGQANACRILEISEGPIEFQQVQPSDENEE